MQERKTWFQTAPSQSINLVMDSLGELWDIEQQKYLWAGEGNDKSKEIGSFEEACCQLFDDSALGGYLEKEQTGLPFELTQTLTELSDALDKIDAKNKTPLMIINSSKMLEIRELAAKAKTMMENISVQS